MSNAVTGPATVPPADKPESDASGASDASDASSSSSSDTSDDEGRGGGAPVHYASSGPGDDDDHDEEEPDDSAGTIMVFPAGVESKGGLVRLPKSTVANLGGKTLVKYEPSLPVNVPKHAASKLFAVTKVTLPQDLQDGPGGDADMISTARVNMDRVLRGSAPSLASAGAALVQLLPADVLAASFKAKGAVPDWVRVTHEVPKTAVAFSVSRKMRDGTMKEFWFGMLNRICFKKSRKTGELVENNGGAGVKTFGVVYGCLAPDHVFVPSALPRDPEQCMVVQAILLALMCRDSADVYALLKASPLNAAACTEFCDALQKLQIPQSAFAPVSAPSPWMVLAKRYAAECKNLSDNPSKGLPVLPSTFKKLAGAGAGAGAQTSRPRRATPIKKRASVVEDDDDGGDGDAGDGGDGGDGDGGSSGQYAAAAATTVKQQQPPRRRHRTITFVDAPDGGDAGHGGDRFPAVEGRVSHDQLDYAKRVTQEVLKNVVFKLKVCGTPDARTKAVEDKIMPLLNRKLDPLRADPKGSAWIAENDEVILEQISNLVVLLNRADAGGVDIDFKKCLRHLDVLRNPLFRAAILDVVSDRYRDSVYEMSVPAAEVVDVAKGANGGGATGKGAGTGNKKRTAAFGNDMTTTAFGALPPPRNRQRRG